MYQRASDVTNVETDTRHSPAESLVKNGIQKLKAEALDEAQWQFEQAINIDPSFGPAYYWLARVRSKFSEFSQALDLLDKAASLLKDSAAWVERIEEFRRWVEER